MEDDEPRAIFVQQYVDDGRRAYKRSEWALRDEQLRNDRHKGKLLLEKLRFKKYASDGSLSNVMQRLGKWGRQWFPWIRGVRMRY